MTRIVLTGANGFLGSWITRILAQQFEVFPLVRAGSDTTKLNGIPLGSIVKYEERLFENTLKEIRPDVVILCDWSGVENRFRNDNRQFENLKRLENRVSALRQISTVIGFGSQAEVGPRQKSIDELEFDQPTTLYGCAKVEARKLLQTHLEGTSRFIWARIFSTYGPLDWDGWLLPSVINAMINKVPMPLTRGEQEWSFLHSLDLAFAFEMMVTNFSIEGIVNVGNPQTVQISSAVTMISDLFGETNLIRMGELPYRSDQVMKLCPLTTKLSRVGWCPKVDLSEGISHLVTWMRGGRDPEISLIDGRRLKLSLPDYRSMK